MAQPAPVEAAEQPDARDVSDPGAMTPLRVVCFVDLWSSVRFFESVLDRLLERGHEVVLVVERELAEHDQGEWVREAERQPRFRWLAARHLKRDPLRELRIRVRRSVDFLHFLRPRFAGAPLLRQRAARGLPWWVVWLTRLVRGGWPLRALTRSLEAFDHALPSPRALREELKGLEADLVVVSPRGMPGARDSDYLKAAKALRIPSAVAVASWDNLSSKQLLHEQPHRLLVWNEIQKREAVELHGVAEERIVVTGAQNFDLWFEWQPREGREFCARVGLDPELPYVLYVGGALYPAELTEAEWAWRWLEAMRASEDPQLASLAVLLRPHPRRAEEWLEVSYEELGDVVVWPRESAGEFPLSAAARADFYDSIYHSAAVVGLNTSAMLEAAIIGRSVHVPLVPDFDASQRRLVHFHYLLSAGGGLPRIADSLEEHFEQLADSLHVRDETAEQRRRRFLEAFIRPHGLDRPATSIFVETLERLAYSPVANERLPLGLALARGLLTLVFWPLESIGRLSRFLRRLFYRLWARPRLALYRWKKHGRLRIRALVRKPLVRRTRMLMLPVVGRSRRFYTRLSRPLVRRTRPLVRRVRKRLRRRLLVWLPAAVRVRRQRLRAVLRGLGSSRTRAPEAPAPEGPWSGIEKLAWGELISQHGLPSDPGFLDDALKRMRRHRRRQILRSVAVRTTRTGEIVSDVYERDYQRSWAEFASRRAKRTDIFIVDGAPVHVDGWFTFGYRAEILDRALEPCGGQTVLEVGAGRGVLLALLALRRPEREFVGLELTAAGVARGDELIRRLPADLIRLSGRDGAPPDHNGSPIRASFIQGDATTMPFEDDSFDVSFTCLALEQMPHIASDAIREMARVTRRYCVFMEPFAEANGPLGMAELRARDYFRRSYRDLRAFGLEPVYFTDAIPQKQQFNKGLLIARVAGWKGAGYDDRSSRNSANARSRGVSTSKERSGGIS